MKCRSKHIRLIHCTLKWDHLLPSQHCWSPAYVESWMLVSLSGILTGLISLPWSSSIMLVFLAKDISQFWLWEMTLHIWAGFSVAQCAVKDIQVCSQFRPGLLLQISSNTTPLRTKFWHFYGWCLPMLSTAMIYVDVWVLLWGFHLVEKIPGVLGKIGYWWYFIGLVKGACLWYSGPYNLKTLTA